MGLKHVRRHVGKNPAILGITILFMVLGYILTSNILFSLLFGVVSFGGSSILGSLRETHNLIYLFLISFILTTLVLWQFNNTVTIANMITINEGGSELDLFGTGSDTIKSSTTTTTLERTSPPSVVTTTTTVYDGPPCDVDCTIFNGNFAYHCVDGDCALMTCEDSEQCPDDYQCIYGECLNNG